MPGAPAAAPSGVSVGFADSSADTFTSGRGTRGGGTAPGGRTGGAGAGPSVGVSPRVAEGAGGHQQGGEYSEKIDWRKARRASCLFER